MKHALRKLARRIHRRSVWQVLAVYVLVAWLGAAGVHLATDLLGLPGWTPTMAVVLLAIGLPVTLATAAIQGLPWLREDEIDPNELVGRTPEEVHVIPELHPMYGARLFTWRNAVLGGVMALAVLVTSVVAYVTMWALGIGPVGSLVAQGVIQQGDAVLVLDFENRSDEIDLGEALSEAMRADLARSRLVSLPGRVELERALERAGHDPSEPPTLAVAMEVAEDMGVAALLVGEVERVGGAYRLLVRLILPPASSPKARFRTTVDDRGELIEGVDELSERARAKLGESLRVIRSEPPLTELYGPAPRTGGR